MIYSKYDKSKAWLKVKCSRCGKPRWCCQHHVDRKVNSDRVVRICSNGNPEGIIYRDACHQWIHANPKLACDEGLYNKLSGTYVKKTKTKDRWTIKKKVSGADKWKINKK